MLTSNIDLNNKKILDVGCGIGDLLSHIENNNLNTDYTGIDILPRMVQKAKEKNSKGKFLCVDIFEDSPFEDKSFDIVYASGIFNLNLTNNEQFIKESLLIFGRLAKEYVCFNLLSHNSKNKEDMYYYSSPDKIKPLINGIYEHINVEIIEGYLTNDFTVLCDFRNN